MADPVLNRLIDQVPGVISHPFLRRNPDQISYPWSDSHFHRDNQSDELPFDIRDWLEPSAFGDADDDLDGHSNLDGSVPGLTSDTSDERGSSPFSPIEESFDRDRLRDLKNGDDGLTLPRKELRPASPEYHTRIHISNNHGSSSGSSIDYSKDESSPEGNFLSSSSSSPARCSPPWKSTPAQSQKNDRGKRTKPLVDRETVAEVRERGACLRCRIRRVKVFSPVAF